MECWWSAAAAGGACRKRTLVLRGSVSSGNSRATNTLLMPCERSLVFQVARDRESEGCSCCAARTFCLLHLNAPIRCLMELTWPLGLTSARTRNNHAQPGERAQVARCKFCELSRVCNSNRKIYIDGGRSISILWWV
jgi:hypothetical protein